MIVEVLSWKNEGDNCEDEIFTKTVTKAIIAKNTITFTTTTTSTSCPSCTPGKTKFIKATVTITPTTTTTVCVTPTCIPIVEPCDLNNPDVCCSGACENSSGSALCCVPSGGPCTIENFITNCCPIAGTVDEKGCNFIAPNGTGMCI